MKEYWRRYRIGLNWCIQLVKLHFKNNQVKRGKRNSRDTKGKHKETSEDNLVMKDKGRKKVRIDTSRRDVQLLSVKPATKLTGICYSKIGECFRRGKHGH